jgi:hypothetical protein
VHGSPDKHSQCQARTGGQRFGFISARYGFPVERSLLPTEQEYDLMRSSQDVPPPRRPRTRTARDTAALGKRRSCRRNSNIERRVCPLPRDRAVFAGLFGHPSNQPQSKTTKAARLMSPSASLISVNQSQAWETHEPLSPHENPHGSNPTPTH